MLDKVMASKPRKKTAAELFEARDWRFLRKHFRMNQSDFWGVVKITQSTGSRYESGRDVPEQVVELLRLIYVEGIDVFNLKRRHVDGALFVQEEGEKQ